MFQNYFDFVSNWLFKILFLKDIISIQSNIKYESKFTEIIAIPFKWWQIFLRKTSDQMQKMVWFKSRLDPVQANKKKIQFSEKNFISLSASNYDDDGGSNANYNNLCKTNFNNLFRITWKTVSIAINYTRNLQIEQKKTCSICFCFYYTDYKKCRLMWSWIILSLLGDVEWKREFSLMLSLVSCDQIWSGPKWSYKADFIWINIT